MPKMLEIPQLKVCPESMRPHVRDVLAGEYDLPPGVEIAPPEGETLRVLDLGANIGAYTLWALARWPGCVVDAYEPDPQNAAMWRENVRTSSACLHEEAVAASSTPAAPLYRGRNNCGEASLYRGHEQLEQYVEVPCAAASILPAADIVKIDVEGSELVILEGLNLTRALAVMLEWHGQRRRWHAGRMLVNAGFECARERVRSRDRGTMVWVRI